MSASQVPAKFRIRVVFGSHGMIGPGKADLLEQIMRTGSIAAGGRALGMSYKRAWQLVETMNAMFEEPVVVGTRGGAKGGGAVLTQTGNRVLEAYRALERDAEKAAEPHVGRLQTMLRDIPGGK